MTRESRTLLVMGVMCVLGVVGLALMADSYRDALTEHGGEEEVRRAAADTLPTTAEIRTIETVRHVDRYLEVRRALKVAVPAERPAGGEVPATLREVRARLLRDVGLDEASYESVRDLVRAWRRGDPTVAGAFREAFERRRAELQAAHLGAFEGLDL